MAEKVKKAVAFHVYPLNHGQQNIKTYIVCDSNGFFYTVKAHNSRDALRFLDVKMHVGKNPKPNGTPPPLPRGREVPRNRRTSLTTRPMTTRRVNIISKRKAMELMGLSSIEDLEKVFIK